MNELERKRGGTTVTYPLVLFISVISVIMIGIFFINLIVPFIWYQKLNSISQKYMFIIEKFGYLTDSEKSNLINELNLQGFDTNNVTVYAPNNKRSYGELIELKIEYNYKYKNINRFKLENKVINMVVLKSSYSKI